MALAALVVAATIALAFAGLGLWSDAPRLKDAAGVIQALAAALAIGLGGVFALFKLQVFRDLTPHLTISHTVGHRAISARYALIDVSVELRNSSKVQIELREAIFRLQMVAPLSDDEAENLYYGMLADQEQARVMWPLLLRTQRNWDEGALIVEPGETHRETCDFIVSKDIETARVYTFFRNPNFREGGGTVEGWEIETVYDMRDYDSGL